MQRGVGAALKAARAYALVAALVLGLTAANMPPERNLPQSEGAALTAVRLQGYQRYHANDSLIGQLVDCSHQEKICFRFNMLFDSNLKECVIWSDRILLLKSLTNFWGLQRPFAIDCAGYVMAYDDRCYRKEVVHDVICGCAAEPSRHFLNGVECRCVPPAPIRVEQPQEDGKCLIPDLRFPMEDLSPYYQNPQERVQGFASREHWLKIAEPPPYLNCTREQQQCFEQRKVWTKKSGCEQLLERGPCPEEHVVALDAQAALAGHVESTCVHVRGGCPQGHVRMPFDGECHKKSDVESAIRGTVQTNQFGSSVATNGRSFKMQPGRWRSPAGGVYGLPVCGVRIVPLLNGGRDSVATAGQLSVKRYEVINTPPVPE